MNYLAIDTSSEQLIVVVNADGKVYKEVMEVGKSGHSRLLMPTIDRVLNLAGISVKDLHLVGAVVGPGSFTGIRIGVSTATALCYALNLKRVSVTKFEVIAYNLDKATAIVDAGHGNSYVAECENGKVISTDFVNSSPDKLHGITQPQIDIADALIGAVDFKIANGEFCNVFEPYYMRKSQAEREKDET